MAIQRKAVQAQPKRQVDDILAKNAQIGESLGLEKVPLHTLTWKEPRLDLDSGDCYPLVDVLLAIAEALDRPKPKKSK